MRFRATVLLSWRARRLGRESVGRGNQATAPSLGATSLPVTYIICTNPRSGSYFLCDGLASTSLAGRPREWFNPLGEKTRRARWGLAESTGAADAAYLNQVRVRSTTRNGISGIKLHFHQFVELAKKLGDVEDHLKTAELMTKVFLNLKYLWLRRRDRARQAISYLLALRTGNWYVVDEDKSTLQQGKIDEPDFDPQALVRLEETFAQNDAAWQAYFAHNNISPLIVYYEDMVADYRGTIVRILKWLAVENADVVAVRPSRLKRQSNARNEDWLQRYLMFKTEQGLTSKSRNSSVRETKYLPTVQNLKQAREEVELDASPEEKERHAMTNGSVVLNGITDRELVSVLEAKVHNEGKINFNPGQLQQVPGANQTYNNLVIAWTGQPGLEVVLELLHKFGSEKPEKASAHKAV